MRFKNRQFESLGQYHDFWSIIVVYAPDRFQPLNAEQVDQSGALEEAFQVVRAGFHFVEGRIKDQRLLAVLRELIELAYDAYKRADGARGCNVFQECEGLIWPKTRSWPLKHVVEAERRAFGSVELFKNVVVSPYPYEGTEADLGAHQRTLLEHARGQAFPRLTQDLQATDLGARTERGSSAHKGALAKRRSDCTSHGPPRRAQSSHA